METLCMHEVTFPVYFFGSVLAGLLYAVKRCEWVKLCLRVVVLAQRAVSTQGRSTQA